MKVKPWQMIVIALGLLIGGGSAAYTLLSGDSVDLTHQYYLIDVENGDLFRVDSKKYRLMLPARHPATGRISLVAVSRGDDGKWLVSPRDRETLKSLDQGVQNNAIDPDSGELTLTPKSPVDYQK